MDENQQKDAEQLALKLCIAKVLKSELGDSLSDDRITEVVATVMAAAGAAGGFALAPVTGYAGVAMWLGGLRVVTVGSKDQVMRASVPPEYTMGHMNRLCIEALCKELQAKAEGAPPTPNE